MTSKLEIDDNLLGKNLVLNDKEDEIDLVLPSQERCNVPSTIITPEPGICVKTKDNNTGQKVFVNVCTSENVPEPEDITNEELLDLFESDDPSDFRIPMSIGSSHQEKDKGGNDCVSYDVVINPAFLKKLKDNPLFSTFFMVVTIEGLDQKYGVSLDKNCWTILKNKKYLGKLPSDQKIRTALPLIQELSGTKEWTPKDFQSVCDRVTPSRSERINSADPVENLIDVVSSKPLKNVSEKSSLRPNSFKKSPSFTIAKISSRPPFNGPLVKIDLEMPSDISATGLNVEIGAGRVIVDSDSYFLDEVFPYQFDASLVKAFFIKQQRILTLWIPLKQT